MARNDIASRITRKVGATSVELHGAQRTSLLHAGREMARIIEAGAPKRLRNVGKNGSALSVKVTSRQAGAHSQVEVRAVGPWQIINNDAKPTRIYRKGQRVRGRGARRINRQAILNEVFGARGAYTGGALKLPDGRFRHVVSHPGHKGKQLWQAGAEKGRQPVAERIRRGTRDALVRGLMR